MLINIFMAFTILSCNSLVYFLNKNDIYYYKKRQSGNLIMPREIVEDSEVKDIVKNYLKNFKCNYLVTSIAILISIPLSTEINIALVIFVLDIFLILFAYNNAKAQKKIDRYVIENYIGLNRQETDETQFDISIIGKTDGKIIGMKWFLTPVILNLGLSAVILAIGKIDIDIFLYINVIYIAVSAIMIYFNNEAKKQNNTVYTTDSVINLKINTEEKGNTSKLLFLTTIIDTIVFGAIWLIIFFDISSKLLLLIIAVTIFILVAYMIKLFNNMQELIDSIPSETRLQNDFLYKRRKTLLGGFLLYDKTNKRSLVSDNTGMNYVPNVATFVGKIWGVVLGICLIFMLVLPIWLTASAFTSVDVDFGGDDMTFKYMEYSKTIDIDEIESYDLLDKYPDVQLRLNGIGLKEKCIGTFKVNGYGKSELYITEDNLPILHLKTKDRSYFVNSSKKVNVKDIYNKLKSFDK
ncbi:PH domain-containing protein [Metaclostridioides mangenotii]|uniref:PH domain-containing protein n=1 Tax=Metaclostridioides mangenotii TaxID=1540 RepID=UPI0028E27EC9|nr:PH domain-containing protein [Clostridioides mangenotii]